MPSTLVYSDVNIIVVILLEYLSFFVNFLFFRFEIFFLLFRPNMEECVRVWSFAFNLKIFVCCLCVASGRHYSSLFDCIFNDLLENIVLMRFSILFWKHHDSKIFIFYPFFLLPYEWQSVVRLHIVPSVRNHVLPIRCKNFFSFFFLSEIFPICTEYKYIHFLKNDCAFQKCFTITCENK